MNTITVIIDDCSAKDGVSSLGTHWRLMTDKVMGGVSQGSLTTETYRDHSCLRLQGDVSIENNGGFIQMALDLSLDDVFDANRFSGIELTIAGNDQTYNLHLRTAELTAPWQSYRASFHADSNWQTIRLPFSAFTPYKTPNPLQRRILRRIGLVAIGKTFNADLRLADIRFYSD